MKLSGQNLIEYLLIAALVAVMGFGILFKFNFTAIKNYVFMRPADSSDASKITIEPMTDNN